MKLRLKFAVLRTFLSAAVIITGLFIFNTVLKSNESPLPEYANFFSIPSNVLDRLRAEFGQSDLPDWAMMDPATDGYEGTSTLKLYDYINGLNPKPEPIPLIVAVMDSGFDIDHPGLKDNIWNNTAEINGQPGVDDDGNGFIDDFYGWNFLGNVTDLNLELTREYARMKKDGTPESDKYFQKVKAEFDSKLKEDQDIYDYIKMLVSQNEEAIAVLKANNITTDPKKLQEISSTLTGKSKDAAEKLLGTYMLTGLGPAEVIDAQKEYESRISVSYDLKLDPSTIIGDNPDKLDEKGYGNNDIKPKGSTHGTHVSGIIASPTKGIGQAPFVKIMCIRVVPGQGDERDKDVANGIRYAVDNGAKVINLSAGKYYAKNADYVIEAIKYAESKDVLFVVAAGNEGTNIESTVNYPPKFYRENGEIKYFPNLVCVGASSWMKTWNKEKDPSNLNRKYDLAASFSNYSGKVVDLFAPGVEINSTVIGGEYKRLGGTSMAAPETAGIASIIRGFFPDLTAAQVKEILVNSSRKYEGLEVKQKEARSKILFSTLSKSGGIVDAFSAYKMASEK
ncbi:MAG: S8 family serine peptidase [Ignavibacteriae bacterium]|nr:S8 family serine peptidase [Ignavibacteriota bacterium]